MGKRRAIKEVHLICAMLISTVLIISGCSEKTADLPAVASLASELVEGQTFRDQLQLLDADVALSLYRLSEADVADSAVYAGTGATAEEVAVFEAVDTEASDRVRKAVETHIAAQKSSFERYIPEEVVKLEQTVIAQRGTVIAVCVPSESGETAKQICKKYGLQ